MSVCCIGQSAYDITVRIDEQLVPDRKYRVESHVECPGGPALNAACVCSKWGEPTSLVSRVGDDQYGSMCSSSAGFVRQNEADGCRALFYSIVSSNAEQLCGQ